MLPKLDGYKACRLLKFDKKYKNIPVIMFTARVQEADEKLGKEVGVDIYLVKSPDFTDLIETVKRLI